MIEITEENGIVEIRTQHEEFLIDMEEEEVLFCASDDIGLNSNPAFFRVLIHLENAGVDVLQFVQHRFVAQHNLHGHRAGAINRTTGSRPSINRTAGIPAGVEIEEEEIPEEL